MAINATFAGQIGAILAVFIVFSGYYLGTRKTESPKLTLDLAFILAFVPPLAFIFLATLVLKKDIAPPPYS